MGKVSGVGFGLFGLLRPIYLSRVCYEFHLSFSKLSLLFWLFFLRKLCTAYAVFSDALERENGYDGTGVFIATLHDSFYLSTCYIRLPRPIRIVPDLAFSAWRLKAE